MFYYIYTVLFDIFNLPRANIEKAHGSSKLENGDAIVYKLKAVNERKTQTTKEDKEAFKNFINSERQISELAELQVAAQEEAGESPDPEDDGVVDADFEVVDEED